MQATATPPSSTSESKTILVADNESRFREVLTLKLRDAGYDVVTARDGQEALDLARTHKPALVVTNYHMPNLSGVELCRRLRREANELQIQTILLTADGYQIESSETDQSGIGRMLNKPFSPRRLLNEISDVMRKAA